MDEENPEIAYDAWHIRAGSAIIDGESSPRGERHHRLLGAAKRVQGQSTKTVLVTFDLLYLNGYDLRKLPLVERKARLKKLIERTAIRFIESFGVAGRDMYAHARKVGLYDDNLTKAEASTLIDEMREKAHVA